MQGPELSQHVESARVQRQFALLLRLVYTRVFGDDLHVHEKRNTSMCLLQKT